MAKRKSNPEKLITLLKRAGKRGLTTGQIIRGTYDACFTRTVNRLRTEGWNIISVPYEGGPSYLYRLGK